MTMPSQSVPIETPVDARAASASSVPGEDSRRIRRRRRRAGGQRRRVGRRGAERRAGRRARPVRVGAQLAAERGGVRESVRVLPRVVDRVESEAQRAAAAERRAVDGDVLVGGDARAAAEERVGGVADGAERARAEQLPLAATPAVEDARARRALGDEARVELLRDALRPADRLRVVAALRGRGQALRRLRERAALHRLLGRLFGERVRVGDAVVGRRCARTGQE